MKERSYSVRFTLDIIENIFIMILGCLVIICGFALIGIGIELLTFDWSLFDSPYEFVRDNAYDELVANSIFNVARSLELSLLLCGLVAALSIVFIPLASHHNVKDNPRHPTMFDDMFSN